MDFFSKGVLDNNEIQNLPLKAKKALIYWQPQFLFCLKNPEPILTVKALLSNGFIIEQLNRDLTPKEFCILLKTNYFMQRGRGKNQLIDKILIENKFPKRIQNAIFKKAYLFNVFISETGLFGKCYQNFDLPIVQNWIKNFPGLILQIDNVDLDLVDIALTAPQELTTLLLNQLVEKILASNKISNMWKLIYVKKILNNNKEVRIPVIPSELKTDMEKIDFLNSKIGLLKRINS